jgi:hypothetical protein
MFNEENRKIKKLINSTLAILLLLLPLAYSSPAYAITQAEYDALVASAQAEIATAQNELEIQQSELDALNISKNELQMSLQASQDLVDQAQVDLNAAFAANEEQSIVVQSALSQLENAKLNLQNKQNNIETISNQIIIQSSVVTAKTLILQAETQKLNDATQSIIDSQNRLNDFNLQKQQFENEFNLANIAYNSALLNYNTSVTNVQNKGTVVDNQSSLYNQSLADVQTKLQQLTSAQNAVDVAQANYNNNLIAVYPANAPATVYGLQAKIYKNATPNYPTRSESAYTYCKTITVTQINKDWGGGDIEGCGGDNILIHYTGYLTVPETMNYQFLANVDDGWYMTLDNMVINDNWTLKGCGGWWSNNFTLQAGRSYAIDAWMYEHGGGACNFLYYSSQTNWGIVPASWLTKNQPTQPTYQQDPALLSILQQKQSLLATAQLNYSESLTNSSTTNAAYLNAIDEYNIAVSIWQTKQKDLSQSEQDKIDANRGIISSDELINKAEISLQEARVSCAQQQLVVAQNQSSLTSANLALELLKDNLTQVRTDIDSTITLVDQLQNALDDETKIKQQTETNLDTKTIQLSTATQKVESIIVRAQSVTTKIIAQEGVVSSASALLANAIKKLTNLPNPEKPVIKPTPEPTKEPVVDPTPKPTIDPTPEPIPTPEPTGDPNIPEIIEDLTKVNLEAVVATNLTEAQVKQLTEAAMQTFETAEQGSPEYEQALAALFVVAQADDIVISEELAAIPGAAALVDAINFIGNVGADMSPKVREESKKIVVTAVVAVGAAVNAATGAALTATTPASGGASTGGSSGGTSRRRN